MKKLLRLFISKWNKNANNSEIDLIFFQTNSEEKFLMEIDKGYAGAIINAGAWTHTSLAIADRLKGVCLPYVEVHISNMEKREDFRQKSFLKDNAVAVVSGKGIKGYEVGLIKLLTHLFAG
jgi:3-dehydroquinate dehydratase-2